MELLQELNQNDGLTIVGVTHNPLSAKYADEVIRMQDGNIIS